VRGKLLGGREISAVGFNPGGELPLSLSRWGKRAQRLYG